MIKWIILFYAVQITLLLIVIFLSISKFDKRYRLNKKSEVKHDSLQATTECFIDPTNQKKYRVHYNQQSGERVYIEETDTVYKG